MNPTIQTWANRRFGARPVNHYTMEALGKRTWKMTLRKEKLNKNLIQNSSKKEAIEKQLQGSRKDKRQTMNEGIKKETLNRKTRSKGKETG